MSEGVDRGRAAQQMSIALSNALVSSLSDRSIFLVDRELRVLLAEGPGVQRLPWVPDDLTTLRRVEDLTETAPADLVARLIAIYRQVFATGERRQEDIERDGIAVRVEVVPLADGDHEVQTLLVVATDISRRLAYVRQQAALAQLAQAALEQRDLGGFLQLTVDTVVATLNAQACELLLVTGDGEALATAATAGSRPGPASHRPAPGHGDDLPAAALSAGRPAVVTDVAGEPRVAPLDALDGVCSAVAVPMHGSRGPLGTLTVHTDPPRALDGGDVGFLTVIAHGTAGAIERHRELEASSHAAIHDALTGLPNRAVALDRLAQALEKRRRATTTAAVLVVDLDRFKVINDSLGHAAGDELLVALADRLRGEMRASDTIARLSGDELVVVCDEVGDVRDVITVAERILAAVNRPFRISSGEHHVTASVGIAVADSSDASAGSLLRDADAAMYRAKRRGPGRFELFDQRMRDEVLARLRTETELRRGIHDGELRVHYQPIVDLHTGRPVGTEALVRWQHPERGLVGPFEFVGIAEETGLIADLGRQVLRESCRQAAAWQGQLGAPLAMSVNVSARQLADSAFSSQTADVAREQRLAPGTLRLEVTETVLIEDAESPVTVLQDLRRHGLSLVLDDFGTGYSSMSYLKRFPLDGLKMDRSFVKDLAASDADAAIMKAVVEMASALGMSVVAEGVETDTQVQRLRDAGCRYAQGYLFSRPGPPDEVAALLERSLSGGARAPGS